MSAPLQGGGDLGFPVHSDTLPSTAFPPPLWSHCLCLLVTTLFRCVQKGQTVSKVIPSCTCLLTPCNGLNVCVPQDMEAEAPIPEWWWQEVRPLGGDSGLKVEPLQEGTPQRLLSLSLPCEELSGRLPSSSQEGNPNIWPPDLVHPSPEMGDLKSVIQAAQPVLSVTQTLSTRIPAL